MTIDQSVLAVAGCLEPRSSSEYSLSTFEAFRRHTLRQDGIPTGSRTFWIPSVTVIYNTDPIGDVVVASRDMLEALFWCAKSGLLLL